MKSSFLIKVCGLGLESWIIKYDIIWLSSREECAVDTFVLCKKDEGRVIIFSSLVTLIWHLSINIELGGSINSKTRGMIYGFFLTEFFWKCQLLFLKNFRDIEMSSRHWNVLRWRLSRSASCKSVTILDVVQLENYELENSVWLCLHEV